MEFDKSKVYTALNADELKVGSKVIVANDIALLKDFLKDEVVHTLAEIRGENYCHRFIAEDGLIYAFAYLVEESEEKLKWTDLKVGDVITKDGTIAMIIQIDKYDDSQYHIRAGHIWISDRALIEWEKVEE